MCRHSRNGIHFWMLLRRCWHTSKAKNNTLITTDRDKTVFTSLSSFCEGQIVGGQTVAEATNVCCGIEELKYQEHLRIIFTRLCLAFVLLIPCNRRALQCPRRSQVATYVGPMLENRNSNPLLPSPRMQVSSFDTTLISLMSAGTAYSNSWRTQTSDPPLSLQSTIGSHCLELAVVTFA